MISYLYQLFYHLWLVIKWRLCRNINHTVLLSLTAMAKEESTSFLCDAARRNKSHPGFTSPLGRNTERKKSEESIKRYIVSILLLCSSNYIWYERYILCCCPVDIIYCWCMLLKFLSCKLPTWSVQNNKVKGLCQFYFYINVSFVCSTIGRLHK